MFPFDPETCGLRISKHFRGAKMRRWGWSYRDIRDALGEAHDAKRVGKRKLEVWVRKGGSKKLVIAYDETTDVVTVITGTEA